MVSLREEDSVYPEGERRSPPASILHELGGDLGGLISLEGPLGPLGKQTSWS